MDTLFRCIKEGTAPDRVVRFASAYLEEAGFEPLRYEHSFGLEAGGKYYVTPFPDLLFAFTLGTDGTRPGNVKELD